MSEKPKKLPHGGSDLKLRRDNAVIEPEILSGPDGARVIGDGTGRPGMTEMRRLPRWLLLMGCAFLLFLLVVTGVLLYFVFVQNKSLAATVEKYVTSSEASASGTGEPKESGVELVKVLPVAGKVNVALLPFTMTDVIADKMLDFKDQKVDVYGMGSLSDADRKSINSVMLGYIKMIDANDYAEARAVNREITLRENEREYKRKLALYDKIVNSVNRPVVLGADYLAGYLGAYSDTFHIVSPELVASALRHMDTMADPVAAWQYFADTTGAAYVLYGTVSDMSEKVTKFEGYGVKTEKSVYELDVLVKLVDLAKQHTVFSKVATGSWTNNKSANLSETNPAVFTDILKKALQTTAADLFEYFKD